jgi:hypothetical protein
METQIIKIFSHHNFSLKVNGVQAKLKQSVYKDDPESPEISLHIYWIPELIKLLEEVQAEILGSDK